MVPKLCLMVSLLPDMKSTKTKVKVVNQEYLCVKTKLEKRNRLQK